jgi:hypothetical protein
VCLLKRELEEIRKRNFNVKDDNYLTLSQVAEFLGCTKLEVKKLVDDGELTPIKALPDDIRYLLSMKEVNKKSNTLKRQF